MLDEIGNLEKQINETYEPIPHILEETQLLKNSYDRKVEKLDLERAIKVFAKLNIKGNKHTKYSGSLEKLESQPS